MILTCSMLVLLSVGSAVNQQSVSCAVSEGGQRQTGDVVVADSAARSGLINLLGQGRRGQGSRVTSRTFSLQQY